MIAGNDIKRDCISVWAMITCPQCRLSKDPYQFRTNLVYCDIVRNGHIFSTAVSRESKSAQGPHEQEASRSTGHIVTGSCRNVHEKQLQFFGTRLPRREAIRGADKISIRSRCGREKYIVQVSSLQLP